MSVYDRARNHGASHSEAKQIERLHFDGMLCRNAGLHAENAGVSYDVWRRLCQS
jgi:hypothetical protein